LNGIQTVKTKIAMDKHLFNVCRMITTL
jgi:hypothetical protein